MLSTRFTCKHWEDIPVPDHLIEYIADCAYLAPSKLGCREFLTVLITDSPRGKEIKNWLYYGHTYHAKGDRGRTDTDSPRGYNGQYLAPLVVAWLNPFGQDGKTLIKSGDVLLEANLPDHSVRKNDIFISSMCAMMAAEEQGLNTGFGSCHDNLEVAKMLGFEGYDCPIMIGVGYAKDMTKEEEKHGVLIPVYDTEDPSVQIGYDATNFQQGHPGCVNRINRRPKNSVTFTI
jgi:nitroreductase